MVKQQMLFRNIFISLLVTFILYLSGLIIIEKILINNFSVSFENNQLETFDNDTINELHFYVPLHIKSTIQIPPNIIIPSESYTVNNESLEVLINKENCCTLIIDALKESKPIQIVVNGILPKINKPQLISKISSSLGSRSKNYSIYIRDFYRNEIIEYNPNQTMPPASISKIPSALLTLIDIDNKKINFEDNIPVQENLKHANYDMIGRLPVGSLVTIKYLIEQSILVSNNTAHYHLHDAVLGGAEKVNSRTQKELKASNFFLNPHQANAQSVGIIFNNIYLEKYLSEDLNDYLINLMSNTGSGLREGIPSGVPNNIKVANKVGFLYGGKEGDTYSDAAIVYGEKTNYVLVILNNAAEPYPNGYKNIRLLSEIIYNELNKD